ncbi:MAG: Ig-like domain-containing protein [Nanoarchaeota archaeon]
MKEGASDFTKYSPESKFKKFEWGREKNKFLFLCLTFIFLIGVVSAWSVQINNPANGSAFGNKPSQFDWSFSGINQSNLSNNVDSSYLINNGNKIYFRAYSEYPDVTIQPGEVQEGWNELNISIKNLTGQTENSSVQFWVDNIDPILTILNPLGNIGYTNTNLLYLIVELTETNPGYYSGTKEIRRIFNYPDLAGQHTNNYDLNSSNIADASHNLLTPDDQQEGNYNYIIYSRDKYPNGNTIREVNTTGVIIRDTLPPTTFISSPLTGLFYAGIVNIISSAVDDTSVTTDVSGIDRIDIEVNDGSTIYTDSCTGSNCITNWDSTSETDGDYDIIATSYDRAGNSDLETITIIIDNTAPLISDNYVLLNGIWTNLIQTVALNPTDIGGSGTDVVRYCEGAGCTPNIDLAFPYQLDYNLDQDTIVRYQAWDIVGNPSLIGEYNVKMDLTAPIVDAGVNAITRVLVAQNANVDGSISGVASYSWTKVAGPGIITFGTPTLEDTTMFASLDGVYTIRLTAIDYAGNSAFDTMQFTWDATEPNSNINALVPDPNNDNTPTLTGTATDITTNITNVEYRIDGGAWNSATPTDGAFDSNNEAYTLTTALLTDGIHTIEIRATDLAGNVETTYASDTFTIDLTEPDSTINALVPDPNNDNTPTLTGTATDITTIITNIEYRINGGAWNPTTPTDGAFNSNNEAYILTTAVLADGVYTIEIRATDLAGNVETTYASDTFTIDTMAPIIDIIAPLTLNVTNENYIITFTDDDLNNPECSVDNSNWIACTSGITILNDATGFAGLSEGAFTLYLKDTDLAGNIGTDNEAGIIKDTTLPIITSFQVVPNVSISQNNPTIISATVSDANLDFTGTMFVDFNNLISSDQILFLANMNDTPVSGPYGPINWQTNYFKIKQNTISEPVGIFITDFAPTEYIVTGYFQNDSISPIEDCMIGFDISTKNLTTSYCAGNIIDGTSKFTVSSIKFVNGIGSEPTEINGSTFTLYDIGDLNNPKLESSLAPSGDYNLILRATDSAENEAGEILNISVDNTYPFLVSNDEITGGYNNITFSSVNLDNLYDNLYLNANANEIVNWSTIRVYDSNNVQVKLWTLVSGSTSISKNWIPVNTALPDGNYKINTTITDMAGNKVNLDLGIFYIDNTLPTLSSISSSVSSSSATIIWTTNENANSNVSYGTTNLTISNTGSATYESSHSISLSSLSASTLYYFNVSSCDAGRNCNTSTQYNFTTSVIGDGGSDGGSSGSGGGSSGGSSTKYYECSKWNEWSACSNAQQKRTCLEKIITTSQKGVIESKFNATEIKTCTASALTPLSNTNTETGKTNIAPIESTEITPGFFARITGGITGTATGMTKSKGGKISLIVLGILTLSLILLAFARRMNKNNLERKIKIIHKSDLVGRK